MPGQTTISLISPAELSYLHTSLTLQPPIRPDARLATQFRPLLAETSILPATNGSSRVCFADGTEAIVGVKAEVERTKRVKQNREGIKGDAGDVKKRALGGGGGGGGEDVEMGEVDEGESGGARVGGRDGYNADGSAGYGDLSWIELNIDIPGQRDDDPLTVAMASILGEALLATGAIAGRLFINRFWHWRLYIDILVLSPPLTYPLPLLSISTHLALLSTRLPALVSQGDEDPFFNDDWEASPFLYYRLPLSQPQSKQRLRSPSQRPPLGPPATLLVASVSPQTILFDPSREELAVADAVLAISIAAPLDDPKAVQVLSIRTIDPPSRNSTFGVLDSENPATLGVGAGMGAARSTGEAKKEGGMKKDKPWSPPQGGMKRGLLMRVLGMVLREEEGGVGREVLEGLAMVEVD
ncbi:hypothetical protein MMC25_002761 [Agyrium rufum]|nr:hypothetical protein [Agyrium rufum]